MLYILTLLPFYCVLSGNHWKSGCCYWKFCVPGIRITNIYLSAIQMPNNCPLFEWHLNSVCIIQAMIWRGGNFVRYSKHHLNARPLDDWTNVWPEYRTSPFFKFQCISSKTDNFNFAKQQLSQQHSLKRLLLIITCYFIVLLQLSMLKISLFPLNDKCCIEIFVFH